MSRGGLVRLAVLTALAVTLAACTVGAPNLDGSWQLVEGRVDQHSIDPPATHPITMTVDGDEVTGTASCNQYGGELRRRPTSVRFADVHMTDMACEPRATLVAEAHYLGAIHRVDRATLTDDELVLLGPGVELRYAPAP